MMPPHLSSSEGIAWACPSIWHGSCPKSHILPPEHEWSVIGQQADVKLEGSSRRELSPQLCSSFAGGS